MTERLQGSTGVARAAELLRGGGTVAFPTETVYGLGANALDAEAVKKVFAAKERPHWDPLIVHVCDAEMLGRVTEVSAEMRARVEALAATFWPGPLTMLLPRRTAVPDAVTAGRALVGVRMPRHSVALELLRSAGVPVAAPSANRFGRVSPTTAAHVLEDLDGRIDAVLDGGATEVGLESTVLDVSVLPMVLYRPGVVTAEEIAAVAGEVRVYLPKGDENAEPQESLPSPGVGIRHYAPRARVVLVEDAAEMQRVVAERAGERVGVMLPAGWPVRAAASFAWGRMDDPEELARRLFAGLRELDARRVDVIVCAMPRGEGIVRAILDRLEKAAKI